MATLEEIRVFNLVAGRGSKFGFQLTGPPVLDFATGLSFLIFKRNNETSRVPLPTDELLQSANSGTLSTEIERKIETELRDRQEPWSTTA